MEPACHGTGRTDNPACFPRSWRICRPSSVLCRTFRIGPARRSSRAKRKSWASTSRVIHWISSWTKPGNWPRTGPPSWKGFPRTPRSRCVAILTGIQRKRKKEGKLWAAVQVEDLEGSVEAMVFSTQYERLLGALQEDKAVLARG